MEPFHQELCRSMRPEALKMFVGEMEIKNVFDNIGIPTEDEHI
jgi:hypothetical protein